MHLNSVALFLQGRLAISDYRLHEALKYDERNHSCHQGLAF